MGGNHIPHIYPIRSRVSLLLSVFCHNRFGLEVQSAAGTKMESERLHGQLQNDPFFEFLAALAKVFPTYQGALTQLAAVFSALQIALIAFLAILVEIVRQFHGWRFDPLVGRKRRIDQLEFPAEILVAVM
jgi:hypothetical protein